MCGIAGFSLSERSKVNARELSHRLLGTIQWRGSHASGFGYTDEEGRVHVYKDAVPGSQLPLKSLPRNAKTVILHTRFTTQGSEHVNENNHPVIGPNQNIALTHNGVIFNDMEVRHDALVGVEMPEVDTAVIAGVLEYYGLEGIGELSGYAAIAWLHNGAPDELHLARIEDSPVAYTWLLDGSFVYASTEYLLVTALDEMKLEYGAVFNLSERTYFQVVNGIIREHETTPALRSYSWGYSRTAELRNATSGGHGFSSTGSTFRASGSENSELVNTYNPNTETWEYVEPDDSDEQKAMDATLAAMALMNDDGEFNISADEYYTIDTDGDFRTYTTLDAMETELKWHAALHTGDNDALYDAEGLVKWVNHFVDIGSIGIDGKTQISWISEPDDIYNHEDPNTDGLGYIREGIGLLSRNTGA